MGWDIKNNWADIAQLETSDSATDSKFESETEFRLQLYTGTHELVLDSGRYAVGFKRMTLQLECEGTEIVLGDRFGDCVPTDQIKISTIETTKTVEGKASTSAKLNASTVLSGDMLQADASASIAGGIKQKDSEARTETKRHVVAKPNDKWQIDSLNGSALEAKHITPEMVLCRVKPLANRNRAGVQANLYAHRHDLVVADSDERKTLTSWLTTENKNKEKLFKLLIGKEMVGGKADLRPNMEVQLSKISSHNSDD